jgi:hypothetical protein
VAFNRTGALVATAGMDGVVKVWNSTDGAPVATLEGPGELKLLVYEALSY